MNCKDNEPDCRPVFILIETGLHFFNPALSRSPLAGTGGILHGERGISTKIPENYPDSLNYELVCLTSRLYLLSHEYL
jgi:hypothetical protein